MQAFDGAPGLIGRETGSGSIGRAVSTGRYHSCSTGAGRTGSAGHPFLPSQEAFSPRCSHPCSPSRALVKGNYAHAGGISGSQEPLLRRVPGRWTNCDIPDDLRPVHRAGTRNGEHAVTSARAEREQQYRKGISPLQEDSGVGAMTEDSVPTVEIVWCRATRVPVCGPSGRCRHVLRRKFRQGSLSFRDPALSPFHRNFQKPGSEPKVGKGDVCPRGEFTLPCEQIRRGTPSLPQRLRHHAGQAPLTPSGQHFSPDSRTPSCSTGRALAGH